MHNENYEKPEWTPLDIICFASNGGWGGQILPNYEDINKSKGFKNLKYSNRMQRK